MSTFNNEPDGSEVNLQELANLLAAYISKKMFVLPLLGLTCEEYEEMLKKENTHT